MSARVHPLLVRALAAVLLLPAAAAAAETLVIHAERAYPVASAPIDDAAIVVRDGRIAAIGRRADLPAPGDATVLRAAVATPGLIDAHTSVGLSGLYNVLSDRDQDETTDPVQASLRAIDAFNPREALLGHLLAHGVTLVQTGPGPATPIAGLAGLFRTFGTSADAMAVRFPSALVFNLGDSPKSTARGEESFPETRMGVAALIRSKLREGAHYRRSGGLFGRRAPDARLEWLGRVAEGELPALFTAHRADDIATALRIARELDLDARIAGGTEAYLVRDALAEAGVPVLVGPVMEEPHELERINASLENAALLAERDVRFAIRSGFEYYVPKNRLVLFEAAVAVANGLDDARALRAITLDAAQLLGVDADYGSLEAGKVGDVVLYDGDPFEYTSHVTAVVGAGEVVFQRE